VHFGGGKKKRGRDFFSAACAIPEKGRGILVFSSFFISLHLSSRRKEERGGKKKKRGSRCRLLHQGEEREEKGGERKRIGRLHSYSSEERGRREGEALTFLRIPLEEEFGPMTFASFVRYNTKEKKKEEKRERRKRRVT